MSHDKDDFVPTPRTFEEALERMRDMPCQCFMDYTCQTCLMQIAMTDLCSRINELASEIALLRDRTKERGEK